MVAVEVDQTYWAAHMAVYMVVDMAVDMAAGTVVDMVVVVDRAVDTVGPGRRLAVAMDEAEYPEYHRQRHE